MATATGVISGVVIGDDLELTRTITLVPAGATLSNAWLTVKVNKADADPGVFQKAITSTDVPGTGQITDTGADGTGGVRFDLTATNTALLGDQIAYHYSVKVKTSTGKIYTPETGRLSAIGRVATITA